MQNFGKVIKLIAIISFIVFVLLFTGLGIYLTLLLPKLYWIGVLVIILGFIIEFFQFTFMYGFGELIDRVSSLEDKICDTK